MVLLNSRQYINEVWLSISWVGNSQGSFFFFMAYVLFEVFFFEHLLKSAVNEIFETSFEGFSWGLWMFAGLAFIFALAFLLVAEVNFGPFGVGIALGLGLGRKLSFSEFSFGASYIRGLCYRSLEWFWGVDI